MIRKSREYNFLSFISNDTVTQVGKCLILGCHFAGVVNGIACHFRSLTAVGLCPRVLESLRSFFVEQQTEQSTIVF